MSTAQHYGLYSHGFRLSTHETYARMRKETPVHRQPGLDGETPIWFVTRYDDVVALLTDNERFVVDPELALTRSSRTITRWAAVDVELGGDSIRRGDLVIAVIGSANRDASQFADPDILDLRREEGKHVGFGRGPHFCLGAALARLETEIALETPLEGLLNLRLAIAEEDLYWLPIPIFRSLESLPVAWDA
ncbi:MAG: cytochrome P450 [Gaiellaceae bacterium]